jgi:hypothetical protein
MTTFLSKQQEGHILEDTHGQAETPQREEASLKPENKNVGGMRLKNEPLVTELKKQGRKVMREEKKVLSARTGEAACP